MPKVLGADKEGRGAVCVLYIRIGSFMQQQSEGVRVIILGSYVQRSCLVMLALVDISTRFKKVLRNYCMATWTTPGAVHEKFTADLGSCLAQQCQHP